MTHDQIMQSYRAAVANPQYPSQVALDLATERMLAHAELDLIAENLPQCDYRYSDGAPCGGSFEKHGHGWRCAACGAEATRAQDEVLTTAERRVEAIKERMGR